MNRAFLIPSPGYTFQPRLSHTDVAADYTAIRVHASLSPSFSSLSFPRRLDGRARRTRTTLLTMSKEQG